MSTNQETSSTILSRSQQNYLCVIYFIIRKKKVARPKEIASFLQVSYASVTGALRSLAKQELVSYQPYSLVELTPKGKGAAWNLIHRQRVLFEFFVDVLQLEEKEAYDLIINAQELMGLKVIQRLQHLNRLYAKDTGSVSRFDKDILLEKCENLCRLCNLQLEKIR